MAIKWELSAVSGTYTNKQGEEKKSYVRCGVILDTKNGLAAKLEALPVNFNGWLYLNEPKPKDEAKPAKGTVDAVDASGEVPF